MLSHFITWSTHECSGKYRASQPQDPLTIGTAAFVIFCENVKHNNIFMITLMGMWIERLTSSVTTFGTCDMQYFTSGEIRSRSPLGEILIAIKCGLLWELVTQPTLWRLHVCLDVFTYVHAIASYESAFVSLYTSFCAHHISCKTLSFMNFLPPVTDEPRSI